MPLLKAVSSQLCYGVLVAASLMLPLGFAAEAAFAETVQDAGHRGVALLLDVYINDCRADIIGDFVLRNDQLFATHRELESFGLVTDHEKAPDPDTLISLADLPDVSWRIDLAAQAVYITALPHCLTPNRLSLLQPRTVKVDAAATGFVLNYDITGTFADPFGGTSRTDLYGLFDARFFVPAGDFQTSFAAQSDTVRGRRVWRLDSSWQMVDPGRMRRFVVGDFISRSLSWSRSLRIGGVQLQSDFALQPDLITFPLPTLNGSSAVPSTLDVLVNGNRILSREIPAGPFEITEVPVINGAGSITMQVTDIFGRQQDATLPFYASNQLLSPGLNSYSLEFGALRRNWGLTSWDYSEVAASASIRRGINNGLTLEGHAEATSGLVMAGFGAVQQVADLATLTFSLAGSRTDRFSGSRFSVGAQRVSPRFSFGANAMIASSDFRDIAAEADGIFTRRQLGGYVGVSWLGVGNFQLAYVDAERIDLLATTDATSRVRLMNASFSRQIGPFSLQASAYRGFADNDSTGALLSLSMSIGPKSVIGVSASTTDGEFEGRFDASRVADTEGDFGYQVHAANGPVDRYFALGQYRAPWGFLSAGVERLGGTSNLLLGMRASVIATGGVIKAGNAVENSFAVVTTAGLPDIRVMRENREVGRTDSKGRLLVTDLRPYQANILAIAVDDLPPEAVVSGDSVTVRPRERSGVKVAFDISIGTSAILHLVDSTGAPLALGSSLRLSQDDMLLPVGHQGIAFVENLRPDKHYNARVMQPNGRTCAVRFVFKVQPGQIADLGNIPCVEQAQ